MKENAKGGDIRMTSSVLESKYLQKLEDYANQRVIEVVEDALHLIEKGELNNIESHLLGVLMVTEKELNKNK